MRAVIENSRSVIAVKSFLRGFPIAGLSACGVLAVSRGSLPMVAVTSFAINIWWVGNVHAAAGPINRYAFAAGAACGSTLVVWLVR